MTKKIFNLSAEELEIIESVREQHNYKTQVEALRYGTNISVWDWERKKR